MLGSLMSVVSAFEAADEVAMASALRERAVAGSAEYANRSGDEAMCPAVPTIAEEEFAARFTAAVCAQKAACGCGGGVDCVVRLRPKFDAVQKYARDNSLEYDPECAREILTSAVYRRGCGLESEFYRPFSQCGGYCEVFRGDVTSGGACPNLDTDVAAYSNSCAAADEYCDIFDTLTCKSFEDLPTMQIGQTCVEENGNDLGECAEGLTCSYESNTCVPEVGAGEACDEPTVCELGLFCDNGVCAPERLAGEACDGGEQCETVACMNGVCRDEPVICLVDTPADLMWPFMLWTW
ncbi:hypothetical protein OV203_16940 [Nannocystis sp. ILAH1]|uniref:hypothetical protein n=1 Tax=Nannocystis sp. ILAH1 TaxID=2996789 RepID=UPI00226F2B96|nr:hypothetical protein [Nannocystis sp. ILAH1]MCY0988825.1 hypothetical protein [Nannocystis sp. ILAH1]